MLPKKYKVQLIKRRKKKETKKSLPFHHRKQSFLSTKKKKRQEEKEESLISQAAALSRDIYRTTHELCTEFLFNHLTHIYRYMLFPFLLL
jgi:hypothetical protein